MKKRTVVLVVLLLILAAGAALVYEALFARNHFSARVTLTVPAGSRASSIADSLEHAGVLRSRALFFIALRLMGKEGELHPGVYELVPHSSNRDIILSLAGARGRHSEVTFPEGITSMAIAHIAGVHLGTDSAKFVALVHDTTFIRSLGVAANSLEGYLFPETYVFDLPVQERDVVARMVRMMDRFLDDTLRARIAALGVKEQQALTMASIVEGEAVADTERARIAGVYCNRVHKHMRLEADPTIQYILGVPRRLSYADLQIDSPYNTYMHEGLPPTPINNPGRRSIYAALYPEENEYLYFVAKGDGSQTHRFSRTLEEHARAVAQYRKERDR